VGNAVCPLDRLADSSDSQPLWSV